MRRGPDSRMGDLNRPTAVGWPGGRTAPLETMFSFYIDNVPDPDSAIAQDPTFDEKMRQQPDVHSALRKRELSVASMPARFEAATSPGINKDFAQQAADYCDSVFNALPRRHQLYKNMQLAVSQGGRGVEWIWQKVGVEGVEQPVNYQDMHKSRFCFDRMGNMAILTREHPVWGEYVSPAPQRFTDGRWPYPTLPGKFMYHVYMAQGGPWSRPAEEGYLYWGRGEDVNLFIPVTFDLFVIRFRMKWLEKFGMPITVLTFADNMDQSKVLQVCEAIRGESIIRIPMPAGGPDDSWFKLDFVEPPTMGYDAFSNFSDTWTRPRVNSIILGSMSAMGHTQDDGGGAYASDVTQEDSGPALVFADDAKNINETINLQLVPYMINAKWPGCPPEYYPRHVLAPKKERNRAAELDILERAARMVPVREADVYDAAGRSKPKEDEEKIFLGQADNTAWDAFPEPVGMNKDQAMRMKERLAKSGIRPSTMPQVRETVGADKAQSASHATEAGTGKLKNLRKLTH